MSSQVLQVLIQGKNESGPAIKALNDSLKLTRDQVIALANASAQQRDRMVSDIGKVADANEKAARKISLAHTAALKEAQRRADAEVAAAKKIADAQVAALNATSRAAKDVGGKLSLLVTAPLVAAGAASLKYGADFQSAMQQSIAIMGPLDAAMRRTMEQTARDVAKTTVHSAEDAAKAYYYLASAGLDANQSIAALPKVAAFAQAGMFDMAKATDFLLNSMKALGMGSKDAAQNTRDLATISDVLVVAANKSNANIQQFAEALSNKAGAAMRAFNIPLVQGVAALAAFADQGVRGATAGEKLDIFLRDVTRAVMKHGEAWRQAGIEMYDSQGNIRNLADVIGQLEKHFEGMSAEAKIAELSHLGFQSRSQAVTLALLGTSGAMKQYQADLAKAGGATQEIADKQLQTFDAQLNLLIKSVKDLGIELGTAMLPAATRFVNEFAKPVVKQLEDMVKRYEELSPAAQTAALGVLGIAVIAGPALLAFSQIAASVSNLITLYRTLAGVSGLGAMVGGVGTGLAMGGAAIAGGALLGGGIGLGLRALPAQEGLSVGQEWDELIAKWTGVADRLTAEEAAARQGNATALARSMGPFLPNDMFSDSEWAAMGKERRDSPAAPGRHGPGGGASTFVDEGTGLAFQSSLYGLDRSTQDRIRKLLTDSRIRFANDQRKQIEQDHKHQMQGGLQFATELEQQYKDKQDYWLEINHQVAQAVVTDVHMRTKAEKDALELGQKNALVWERMYIKAGRNVTSTFVDVGQAIGGVWGHAVGNLGEALGALTGSNKLGLGSFFSSTKGKNTLTAVQTGADVFFGGMQLGNRVGSPGKGALAGGASGLVSGAITGAMIGAPAGGITAGAGAIIGGAAGLAIGAIGGFIGGKKAQREQQDAMEKMRHDMLLSFGGMENLRKQASLLGVDISRAFTTKEPKEFQAIVDRLNQGMADQQKRMQGVQTAMLGLDLMTKGFTETMAAHGVKTGMAWDAAQEKLQRYEKALREAGVAEDEIKQRVHQRENQLLGGGGAAATEAQQAAFGRLGDYAAATFGAMVKESGDVIGALQQMEPTLSQLAGLEEEFGLKGSAALQELLGLRQIVVDNADIAQSIQGLNLLMKGLGDAGINTSSLFQGFGTDLAADFQALKDKGVDANQALILMQPSLQRLWEHQQKFHDITDEATLKLLKEGETSGIVGEEQRSTFDKILDVLKDIRDFIIPDKKFKVTVNKSDPGNLLGGGSGNEGEEDPENRGGRGRALGAFNEYLPPQSGGHWRNFAESGRGEYLTVTDKPISTTGGGGGSVHVGEVHIHAAPGDSGEDLWEKFAEAIERGGAGRTVTALSNRGFLRR
jgi:TP901 family phage tail tape measure protein